MNPELQELERLNEASGRVITLMQSYRGIENEIADFRRKTTALQERMDQQNAKVAAISRRDEAQLLAVLKDQVKLLEDKIAMNPALEDLVRRANAVSSQIVDALIVLLNSARAAQFTDLARTVVRGISDLEKHRLLSNCPNFHLN